MKKLVISVIAIVSFSASAWAQGTMLTIDNINGMGNRTATSFGLFFGGSGEAYTGPSINVEVFGGPNADSLSPVVILTGANALIYSGTPGIYLDPTFSVYDVPGVAAGGSATLQVRAWRGTATTYSNASLANQFWGPQGIPANTFTFSNPTGESGPPPGPPRSLDGMPAMHLFVPEPSTTALAILGGIVIFVLRRRRRFLLCDSTPTTTSL